jgi:hypothetical protein
MYRRLGRAQHLLVIDPDLRAVTSQPVRSGRQRQLKTAVVACRGRKLPARRVSGDDRPGKWQRRWRARLTRGAADAHERAGDRLATGGMAAAASQDQHARSRASGDAAGPPHVGLDAWRPAPVSGVAAFRQDGLVPETPRPSAGAVALAEWCARWLGAPPEAELFETGNLSAVTGLRLSDGREVVVKMRPSSPRLAGCAVVHRALFEAGFPCPEPLAGLHPLNGFAASAEVLVSDVDEPPQDGLAEVSAAALAHLVELAPAPGSVPSLTPSPSWVGWDHTGPGLWPRLEGDDADLDAYPEPRWLDRVAAAVRGLLLGHASDPVIGHGDWHPENLRWKGTELIAVHDWDSVICQPEPAIAGFAAVSFLGIYSARPLASVEDSAAFLDAYQAARGRRWTSQDHAAFWAAGLWQRAVDAKHRSLEGDPEQILTRHEAQARLHRAGLDLVLAGDGTETG